jgi:hypothetical protein
MLNGASYNDPRKFLETHEYKNLTRWTKQIAERPAVKRGRMVNRASGAPHEQMHERAITPAILRPRWHKVDARRYPLVLIAQRLSSVASDGQADIKCAR